MSGLTAAPAVRRDLVVIGGSAGALEALRRIVKKIPPRLPAAVCIVIHVSPESEQLMASILARSGPLPASYAEDGEPVRPGRIYVARPDHHLLLEPGVLRLARGPKENGFRPAIDPLFRTAAASYGPRTIGIILSGGKDDGTQGMAAIGRAGGVTVAQDPEDAAVPGMPGSAIEFAGVDHVRRADDIPALLAGLVTGARDTRRGPRSGTRPPSNPSGAGAATDPAEAGTDLASGTPDAAGRPSVFICPECGGPLWELGENRLLHYRCHVGHAFTGESLVGAQADALEHALWTALRTLEESAALRRRMAAHARERGMDRIAQRFDEQGDDFDERAAIVRKVAVVEKLEPAEDRQTAAVARRARRATKS
jgi:two-component system chemotaxis response regulator CheB